MRNISKTTQPTPTISVDKKRIMCELSVSSQDRNEEFTSGCLFSPSFPFSCLSFFSVSSFSLPFPAPRSAPIIINSVIGSAEGCQSYSVVHGGTQVSDGWKRSFVLSERSQTKANVFFSILCDIYIFFHFSGVWTVFKHILLSPGEWI